MPALRGADDACMAVSHEAGDARRTLTPEDRDVIGRSRKVAKPVLRAATIASVSGWTLAVFGGLSVLLGIFSIAGLLLGVGLLVCALQELRGAAALRRFEVAAPQSLMMNQCALCVMLVAYSGWMLYTSLTGEGL